MWRIEEEEEWLQVNVRWIENKVQGTRGMGCKKCVVDRGKRKMVPGGRRGGLRERKNGNREVEDRRNLMNFGIIKSFLNLIR